MKTFLVLSTLLILNSFTLFAQWQPDVRLSDFPFSSITNNPTGRNIAADESVVHAVWEDNRHGLEREIYYKRSTDEGISWGADTRLTNDPANSDLSSVAVSGQVVYVVWYDLRNVSSSEIYCKRSTDAGLNWGDDIRLTDNAGVSSHPSVTVFGQIVHVVWQDSRDGNQTNQEIYYKRSTDGGESWGTDTRLTNNSAISWRPSVSVSGSVVHVVWQDTRDGANGEIYYKRSTDGGESWGTDTRLTNDPAISIIASLAVSGSVVHVCWHDTRDGHYEIYYKRSTDGGESWGIDTRLTNDPDGSVSPSVAVSGLTVHVVWDRNSDIHYKSSTDGGVSWSTDTRLMNVGALSENPSLAVSDTVVHVLWHDFRDGQGAEIYYKRNPTGNPTGVEDIGSEFLEEFILEQNYPNPFNPNTTISFSIPELAFVTLKVYDVLGNEVATLLNEQKPAGTYKAQFDASNLSSGMYLYKLQAGSFVETKKMVLLK